MCTVSARGVAPAQPSPAQSPSLFPPSPYPHPKKERNTPNIRWIELEFSKRHAYFALLVCLDWASPLGPQNRHLPSPHHQEFPQAYLRRPCISFPASQATQQSIDMYSRKSKDLCDDYLRKANVGLLLGCWEKDFVAMKFVEGGMVDSVLCLRWLGGLG